MYRKCGGRGVGEIYVCYSGKEIRGEKVAAGDPRARRSGRGTEEQAPEKEKVGLKIHFFKDLYMQVTGSFQFYIFWKFRAVNKLLYDAFLAS